MSKQYEYGQARSPVVRAMFFGLVLALAVFFLGPANQFGPDQPAPREAPPAAVAELDAWLARQEAAVPDIREGLHKQVTWHGPPGERTEWAVVYVHGFTASRLETAPLALRVAQGLGANLFETRLTGHGRSDPQAMGEASVQDWLADTVEAVRIGQMLGERVLLIGVSTGATLGTWVAAREEGQGVAGYVFISPNYGPKDKKSELINQPWGMKLALYLEGEMRGEPAEREAENHAWTQIYPTRALFPMMALVKRVRESDLATFTAPVLMLYAEADQTVDPQEIRALFPRIGSANKTLEVVDYSEAPGQHVLAGDLRAPKATERMARRLIDWAQGL
jgi:alpha-beta hydrolase superfamily lysophospholipase